MNPYLIGWITGAGTVLVPIIGIWFILPWIRCFVCHCPMDLGRVVGMRLRRTPVTLLCDAYIALRKGGVDVGPATLDQLENIWLAHPGLFTTPEALIEAYEREQPDG